MSSIKRVQLTNVQSHVNTVIDLPETGIIRFYGDNSNGKSVMVKIVWDAVSNGLSKPKYRKSIIRRGNMFGEAIFERYDGVTLKIHVHIEAAQTYCELLVPGQPVLRRYLADKTIPELIDQFGFHYHSTHEVSVNIHQGEDPLLFTSTKHGVNYDLMDSAMSDKHAEHSLAEMERLLAESKQTKKLISTNLEMSKAALGSLTLYDIESERSLKEVLEYVAYNLKRCETKELPMVYAPPAIQSYKTLPPIPEVRFYKVYPILGPIPCALESAKALESIRESVCPTCGHKFKEEHNELFHLEYTRRTS